MFEYQNCKLLHVSVFMNMEAMSRFLNDKASKYQRVNGYILPAEVFNFMI